MNPQSVDNPDEQKDQALDNFLCTAKVEVPLPSAFQADVWRRIAVRHQSSVIVKLSYWTENFFGALVNPLPAAVTLVFMVTAGIWFGVKDSEAGNDGKTAYVRSVSPFAADHQGGSR